LNFARNADSRALRSSCKVPKQRPCKSNTVAVPDAFTKLSKRVAIEVVPELDETLAELESATELLESPYSKAPRSGALPTNGKPRSSPLSIARLPSLSFRKPTFGKLPSALRGPSIPGIVERSLPVTVMLGSSRLSKSSSVKSRFRFHVLFSPAGHST